MPGKIQFQEPTLNGRAQVIAYSDREYLSLRIPKGKGSRDYWIRSLGTADIATAHERALDVYTATVSSPQKSKKRKHRFSTACENFLAWKKEQADIGQIKQSTLDSYDQRIYQRIIPYCKLIGIDSVSDIKKDSFSNYGTYHRKVGVKGKWKTETKGLAVSTINSDLTTLNELLNWCVKNDLLEFKDWGDIGKLRDRKDYSEESNPAYFPDQWEQVKSVLKEYENSESDDIKKWVNCWYKNWVFFQYHGGFRVHETRKIKLGDIQIIRKSGKVRWGVVHVSPQTKTGKRTVVMNGNWLNSVKYHLNKGVKLRNEQIKEHNKMVEEGTLPRWKKVKTLIDLLPPPSADTLLMSNPFGRVIQSPVGADKSLRIASTYVVKPEDDINKSEDGINFQWCARVDMTPYTDETIRQRLDSILSGLDFYKKSNFTLHSLRSTHITHALLRGMDVRKVADNVGNSQSEIERTYYRLNNLLNMEELGFFKQKLEKESLFSGEKD